MAVLVVVASSIPARAADDDPFLSKLYDSLHDSPMQRKIRDLAPMPFGVVFLPWKGMTEQEMREHFRLMKKLGFHNLKQTLGTPEWTQSRVLEVALEEGVIPFWYGEAGWEAITPELLAKLDIPANLSIAQIRTHPKMLAYQKEVLRKGIQLDSGRAFLEGGEVPELQGFTFQPDPFLRKEDVRFFLRWLKDLEGDVRTGGTLTAPGRVLHAMGARGLESGTSKATGEFMGSTVLGPIHTAQGVAETPQHPVRGPVKAIGGVLETLTIPSAFVAPEAAGKLPGMLPSAERAGQKFQQVMSVARHNPVDVAGPGNVALEIDKLAQSGGWLPKVVRDFLKRTTDPAKGPLTYEEARAFYSNATRLSVDEMKRLTPNAKRMIGKFTQALGDSVKGAASDAGQLEKYNSAMKEYYRAARTGRQLEALKKYAIKTIPYAAGAYAADKVIRDLPHGH